MEDQTNTHKTAEELHIHMPPPSLSPIILALGMTIGVFGIAFGPVWIIIGSVVTLLGLGTWIYDDIKNASADHNSHGQH
jgi:hypothetical protein